MTDARELMKAVEELCTKLDENVDAICEVVQQQLGYPPREDCTEEQVRRVLEEAEHLIADFTETLGPVLAAQVEQSLLQNLLIDHVRIHVELINYRDEMTREYGSDLFDND